MSEKNNRHESKDTSSTGFRDKTGLERLIFFSDAVFAIAITLLVIDIRLPDTDNILDNAQLTAQLLGMWQEYLGYIISFLVIGTFWTAHHRKFRYIKRYDYRLLFLNLLMLMVIAFIPFPSSVISQYPDRSATIFYALIMATAGLTLGGIWWYATARYRLVDPDLDPRIKKNQFFAPLMTALIFIVSCGLAFVNVGLSRISWLLILFVSWYSYKDVF